MKKIILFRFFAVLGLLGAAQGAWGQQAIPTTPFQFPTISQYKDIEVERKTQEERDTALQATNTIISEPNAPQITILKISQAKAAGDNSPEITQEIEVSNNLSQDTAMINAQKAGFPTFIDTGDAKANNETYAQKKAAWVNANPALYLQIANTPQPSRKVKISRKEYEAMPNEKRQNLKQGEYEIVE